MVGGVVLGAAIGLVAGAGLAILLAARRARLRRTADPVGAAIDVARRRYDGLHPRFKWYARMKYVMDPCYRAIAALVPAGAFTVDLGSGLGMLPVLLGTLGEGRRALGIEWDAQKVACGVHAAAAATVAPLPGVELVEGDARTRRDSAVRRHHARRHAALLGRRRSSARCLARCRAALRPGGRLLVREGDPSRRGGARFTRAVEAVVTRLGWNRGPAVRFRPIASCAPTSRRSASRCASTKWPLPRIPATCCWSAKLPERGAEPQATTMRCRRICTSSTLHHQ